MAVNFCPNSMAPGRWQTDEQFEFLTANVNAFLTASATSRFPKFWPDITERWFANWPEAQAQINLNNLPADFVETVPDEEDSEDTIANRALLKKAVESRQNVRRLGMLLENFLTALHLCSNSRHGFGTMLRKSQSP